MHSKHSSSSQQTLSHPPQENSEAQGRLHLEIRSSLSQTPQFLRLEPPWLKLWNLSSVLELQKLLQSLYYNK